MRTTTLYCQRSRGSYDADGQWHHDRGEHWTNFAAHPRLTRMYDSKAPIYEAVVTEGVDEPGSYWSWWNNVDGRFTFTYYARGLVEMCFPYGTRVEEERGAGRLLPVRIEATPIRV